MVDTKPIEQDDLPALFLDYSTSKHKVGELYCLRCGKKIKGKPTLLYRDWRINEFSESPGPADGAPNPYPDGPYEFGSDCATKLKIRAVHYLEKYMLEKSK